MRVRGEVIVNAPVDTAWRALADISSHVEWMADAESITFTSTQREGVGTTFDCETKVGPLRTTDKMTVSAWDARRRLGVAHTGIVVGSGTFDLDPSGSGTRLSWTENLRFPWFLGGNVTAFLARPVLRRIWMGNLHRFAELVENLYRQQ